MEKIKIIPHWLHATLPSGFNAFLMLEPWQTHCVTCGQDIPAGAWCWWHYHTRRAIHDGCAVPA